jgi:hypothetical protein
MAVRVRTKFEELTRLISFLEQRVTIMQLNLEISTLENDIHRILKIVQEKHDSAGDNLLD